MNQNTDSSEATDCMRDNDGIKDNETIRLTAKYNQKYKYKYKLKYLRESDGQSNESKQLTKQFKDNDDITTHKQNDENKITSMFDEAFSSNIFKEKQRIIETNVNTIKDAIIAYIEIHGGALKSTITENFIKFNTFFNSCYAIENNLNLNSIIFEDFKKYFSELTRIVKE